MLANVKLGIFSSASFWEAARCYRAPRFPLYLFYSKKGYRCNRCFGHACRSGLLPLTKPQAPQQDPACSIPAALPGSDGTATQYLAAPARPSLRPGLAFCLHKRLVYSPIVQAFQPFHFFNCKGKAQCAAVKGL